MPEQNLATDLGLDSLDTAEVVAFLSDQFDIEGVPAKELTTVARVMAMAAGKVTVQEEIEEEQRDTPLESPVRKKTCRCCSRRNHC